ncbi:chromatin modification-related protein eaf7 protein [Diplodia corticola]|uniref:Chromatin modification-related protein eaf7 protein n=1 Tax=Diplodia corticola TaxID=236234 RepID=A0A1J9S1M0_9PEZI|nr:chromatin modification-related protein eaf7 protein [Diplodia corticola]OJD34479.1 chromatin modification-related protein eaf7 protein [Diplodia corticola]
MPRSPASLPTLPEEMIDVIISFTDHETQQLLRLCCKQFNRLTAPRYFRNFRFRFSQLSLDGLICIANHPSIAKYVQHLEFNSHQLLWLFDFDHFLRELRLHPGQPWRPPPGLKHVPTQDFTHAQLYQIYAAYTSERDTPADYVDCILSRAEPSNPLLPVTYPSLPHALASLPNLHAITVTFGMEHQQFYPVYDHTWRGLAFGKPDPEPPGDRDNQKAIDLSCLMHALGRATTTTTRRLPLRTLTIPTIGPSIFGPIALQRLWNIDGPSRPARNSSLSYPRRSTNNPHSHHRLPTLTSVTVAAAVAPTASDSSSSSDDEQSLYHSNFRTFTAVAAGLTRLDLHLNWSSVGGVRNLVNPLAAFLGAARGLVELALVVEREGMAAGRWRGYLTPDDELWRGKDVLLAMLGRRMGEQDEGEGWGEGVEEEGEGEEEEEGAEHDVEVVGVRWPCLRKLTLGMATTEDGLLGLLGRVAGTLRSLTLCNVRFVPRLGDWGCALREMREVLELEELEMSRLMHDMAGFYVMLAPRNIGVVCVEDSMADKRYRMIYRHYEAQVVDYVMKKSDREPELDQGAFFQNHPEYCEWCKEQSLENEGKYNQTSLQ